MRESSVSELVTSHDAFRYYANEHGLRVISVIGTSTDADININMVYLSVYMALVQVQLLCQKNVMILK